MRKSSLYKALNESGSFSLEQWQKLGVEIMKNRPPEWDEVVEDNMTVCWNDYPSLVKHSLSRLLDNYFYDGKSGLKEDVFPVRIKCRKGAILIEKI